MTPNKKVIASGISQEELNEQRDYAQMVAVYLSARFSADRPSAFVRTFGCQGNVADGETIKGLLESMGYALTEDIDTADFILYNTCAVREHAQDRVYGNVGALKPLKESRPELFIALCGCMMQQDHVVAKIKKSYPFVNLVFGTHVIHKLPELVYRALCGSRRVYETTCSDSRIAEDLPVHRDSGFKAWLPVMYGCNNYCSYCVVPYVRGRERSRDPERVLAQAAELVAAGYKEITLLGQNVNSYGNDLEGDYNFSRLLRGINALDGEFIIRFMTSHPKDCTPELLETMAACDKTARHLHLPFQSGNNRVLERMNRGYTRERYEELIAYARKVMPDISLTSDVIVGFPGETYEEFCDTLTLVRRVRFTSLFTFIYSPREGTAAWSFEDTIPRQDKARWFKELTNLQEHIAAERTASMCGKVFRVLCEEPAPNNSGNLIGRTQGNVIIEFPAPMQYIGQFVSVKVTQAQTWKLKGELVGEPVTAR